MSEDVFGEEDLVDLEKEAEDMVPTVEHSMEELRLNIEISEQSGFEWKWPRTSDQRELLYAHKPSGYTAAGYDFNDVTLDK